jgi:hypothetical protein
MPEIEEELSIDLNSETIRLATHANGDRIAIDNIQLTDEEVATLAWLVNQAQGTVLTLELKVK